MTPVLLGPAGAAGALAMTVWAADRLLVRAQRRLAAASAQLHDTARAAVELHAEVDHARAELDRLPAD